MLLAPQNAVVNTFVKVIVLVVDTFGNRVTVADGDVILSISPPGFGGDRVSIKMGQAHLYMGCDRPANVTIAVSAITYPEIDASKTTQLEFIPSNILRLNSPLTCIR